MNFQKNERKINEEKRFYLFLILCAGILNGTPKSDAQKIFDK
ncbi:hypothetical protein [Leptotrichia sp. OH3620_COT-345]|nr:hypothetical protein [Leptotrichia sp. OH3620_COT-345]